MKEIKIIKVSIAILVVVLVCICNASSEEQSIVEPIDELKHLDKTTGSIIVEQNFLYRPHSGRLYNMCWW